MSDRLSADQMLDLRPGEIRAYLIRLREDTDAALLAAEAQGVKGPINWGDLACVSAGLTITVFGGAELQVVISEASPDASELRQFVADQLRELGWGDVEVLTEW